jgi:HEPN domain-containing protein
MTTEEHIAYWIDSAENDLQAANNLFDSRNYDWCLFLGHLVLEKALKAIYIKSNDNIMPPKIHNLTRLVELSNLSPEIEIERFLVLANKFHIEGRYPEFKTEFYKTCTREYAEVNFIKIKEVYQWLKSQIY